MNNKRAKSKLKQWLLLFPSLITAGTAITLLTACKTKKAPPATKPQGETSDNKPPVTATNDVQELFAAVKRDFGFVDADNNSLIQASFEPFLFYTSKDINNLINLKVNDKNLTSISGANLLKNDEGEAKSNASYNFLTEVLKLTPRNSAGKANTFDKTEAAKWKLQIQQRPPNQEFIKLTSDKINLVTNGMEITFHFVKTDASPTATFKMPLKEETQDLTATSFSLLTGTLKIESVVSATDIEEKLTKTKTIDKNNEFQLDLRNPIIITLIKLLNEFNWELTFKIVKVTGSDNKEKNAGAALATGDLITFNVLIKDKNSSTTCTIPLPNQYQVK